MALEDPGTVEVEKGAVALIKEGQVSQLPELQRLFDKAGELAVALAEGR